MRAHFLSSLCTWTVFGLLGCSAPLVEGGSNGHDRTAGGDQGEALLTGAMVVSPDGRYALMQRNQTSVLFDVSARSTHDLPNQVSRLVFSKDSAFAIALLPKAAGVVAYELPSLKEKWRLVPAFRTTAGATFARLSDNDKHLVLGDFDRVFVVDATLGTIRRTVSIGSTPRELAFVPDGKRALVVGSTSWLDHKPKTPVVNVDLVATADERIDVPNCSAPISVLPGGERAFLSPTFCEEGKTSTARQNWTNPDPVSVIDWSSGRTQFLKNLPGFGPVAMDEAGTRAVAYLDMQRLDESMFDDKSKIPPATGARYHIMIIEPKTLAYRFVPIGNVLPRFAMTKSGQALLVDATVQQMRGEVSGQVTVDSSGRVTASLELFGRRDSLFGLFDLERSAYAPFAGTEASLDRFVQMGDNARVFTLKTSADGMGGDLYRIDLATKAVAPLGRSLRDIGLLPDGKTLLLRERLPAGQLETSAGFSWYRRERYCLSLDGIRCELSVDYQDKEPFQSGPRCTDYHDC